MPRFIVELEIWSLPGARQVPFDGKEVAQRCRDETGLDSMVVLGLSFVPGPIDTLNLGTSLSSGELHFEDFAAFCGDRGLESNPDNEHSAAEFLAYAEGQALAWLHVPAEAAGLPMARTLVNWASKNGFQIHDGASTYEPLTKEQIYSRWSRNGLPSFDKD